MVSNDLHLHFYTQLRLLKRITCGNRLFSRHLFHCFLALVLLKCSVNPFRAPCSVEEQRRSVLHQRQADHRHATPLRHRRDHLLLPPTHQWTGDLGSNWAHKHDPDCYGNITVAGWSVYLCTAFICGTDLAEFRKLLCIWFWGEVFGKAFKNSHYCCTLYL